MCSVAHLCLTLCCPMDCSLLGSSAHGIFQARILKWVAISYSRGSPQPTSPALAGGFLTIEPPGKPICRRAIRKNTFTFSVFFVFNLLLS